MKILFTLKSYSQETRTIEKAKVYDALDGTNVYISVVNDDL